jgi:hypothetical protein
MGYFRSILLIFAGIVVILHGTVHVLGLLGSWNLVTFEDLSRQPNFLLTGASETTLYFLGAIWLFAAISFVAAGIGLLRRAQWWPLAMAMALVLSVPMTMLWREDAVVGLMLNGVLIAVMAGWYLLGIREEQKFA